MSLNAKKVKGPANANRVEQPNLDAGNYPARLVQVIDFGLQPQKPYKGEEKPPVNIIGLTYEMSDEFMIDDKGNIIEDKPRWISEQIPLYNLSQDKAKSTQRYNALDPQGAADGDFTQLLSAPVNVTIVNNESGGKIYDNVASLSPMRPKDAARIPELINDPVFFTLDAPDLEVFGKFPAWIQDKIKANLNFNGSLLQDMLSGKPAENKPKPAPKKKEEKEDPPFVPDEPEDTPY